MYRTEVSFLILWFEGCPGSGCSPILDWATLPASKDAESPSKMVLLVLLVQPPGKVYKAQTKPKLQSQLVKLSLIAIASAGALVELGTAKLLIIIFFPYR